MPLIEVTLKQGRPLLVLNSFHESESYRLRFSTANIQDFHTRLQQMIFLLKLDQGELTAREKEMGVEDFEYPSIVIPICDFCLDLAFVVDDEDLSFYKASN